ncbi:MAG: hypothetical protein J6A36_00945 [Clostridia bacterium]|nr:hypothetical protein [Clostridia bacterium]
MKKSLFIILLVVLILEITLFNVNSYRVLNNDSKIEYTKEELEYFETNSEETYIEIKNINTEIKTIHIKLDTTENVEYQVLYTDETSSCLRELPRKRYIDNYKNSEYIPCYLSGKSQVIAIKLFSNVADFEKVTINEKIPFHFNTVRVCIVFGIITFIYLLKTKDFFKIPFSQKDYSQEIVLIFVLCVFILIISFIWRYSADDLEMLDNYCIDFVDALSAGQVHLLENPSEKLMNLENPYDDEQRINSGLLREKDFLWDVAYYNGNYYMYFGILPAIIMLPYHLITGKYITSAEMVFAFSVLTAISLKALIKNVFNRFFKEVPFKFMVFSLIMLLFGSQILWLNGIPRFYELSIISALFFAVTGINFMFYSTEEDSKHKYWYMFIACLMLSLAVACRPTQLLSTIIVVPILLKIFIQNVKEKKDIIKNILAVLVPYLTVGIALMYYNYIRFGSIFEFGASYQLTINDMTNLGNRFMTIGMGIVCSLFSIPNFIPNFPFMYCHNNLLTFYGFYYIENVMGGLFIMVPICLFIFGIFKVWKRTDNKSLLTFTITLIIVRNYNVFT